jgi:hypothetical protein
MIMNTILSPHEDNNLSGPETPFLDLRVKKKYEGLPGLPGIGPAA